MYIRNMKKQIFNNFENSGKIFNNYNLANMFN